MNVLNGYCYNGQHRACSGTAWTAEGRRPQLTRCACPCHTGGGDPVIVKSDDGARSH